MAQTSKNYDMTVYPVQVAVRSASDGAAVHMVTLPHCDCADFTNRRGRLSEDGGPHVSVCKHIAAALECVGGWHRGEPETQVFENLMHGQAKMLLQGEAVGLMPRQSNAVLREATEHVCGFTTADGALCDGTVEYDRLHSRYKVTLQR